MKMKKAYVTFLTPLHDEKDTVLVEVPDYQIIGDAIDMARDAIGLNGIMREDEEKTIPEPTAIDSVDISASSFLENGEPIVTLVDIDFSEYRKKIDNRSVRRNVTLPNWLNQAAEAAHLNVSRVLQEALMDKLGVSA